MIARLSASVPPEVNTTWLRLAPDRLGDVAACLLEARARGAAKAVRTRRIAEDFAEIRTHGLANFGADRCGGGVIEVGQGRFHKA